MQQDDIITYHMVDTECMTDNVIIFTVVSGLGFIIVCITLYWMKYTDIRSRNQCYSEQIYTELLYALTMVIVSGDEEQQAKANMTLAQIVNKVNLIAGTGVLSYLNAFLELQNSPDTDGKKSIKEHAILNALVFAIRKETRRPPSERVMKRKGFKFKFYMPVRHNGKEKNRD